MNYTLKEKTKRNQAIRDYKKLNPDSTLADMKKIFGLSRQRIGVILKGVKNGTLKEHERG